MGKNRVKKSKNNGVSSMETDITFNSWNDAPQAMETSEGKPSKSFQKDAITRKIKKGVQMKRSKNARKQKAIAKAVALGEKTEEKVSKGKNKMQRIQAAKSLYD